MADNIPYDEKKLLLLRIAEGDGEAFYLFYKYYAPRLRGYVWKSTRSEADTEEILQGVFVRVWLSRDKLTGIDNVPGWLYTLTANLCLQYYRKKKREDRKMAVYAELRNSDSEEFTPVVWMELAEIRRNLQTFVKGMPDKQREIYRLSREEGKKAGEIAGLLDIPVGTVKNLLSAANKDVRAFLVKKGYGGLVLIYIFLNIY